jgi:phospholipid transport system substrate-binding protein
MTRWHPFALALCFLLAGTAFAAAAADPSLAVGVIQQLDDGLLGVMKDAKALGYQGRFDRLASLVDHTYDVPFMAEKVLGSHWQQLDEAARTRWIGVFRQYLVANYAGNFTGFSGQRFEVLGQEPAPNDTTLVKTVLHDPGNEDVDLTYRMRDAGQGWRIGDIYLKGTVSELALRRSDYASVLDSGGLDALVGVVQAKIADLAAGRGRRPGAAG